MSGQHNLSQYVRPAADLCGHHHLASHSWSTDAPQSSAPGFALQQSRSWLYHRLSRPCPARPHHLAPDRCTLNWEARALATCMAGACCMSGTHAHASPATITPPQPMTTDWQHVHAVHAGMPAHQQPPHPPAATSSQSDSASPPHLLPSPHSLSLALVLQHRAQQA